MIPATSGELMLFTDSNVFSTAKLKTGSGNSGKLVSEVKTQLRSAAPPDTELTIIDGSPGIGCPVIASLSGVDMVLIVTEPTVSGISDLKRIVKTSENFHVKISVCINKYDLNLSNSAKIEAFCSENSLNFVGSIPYDPEAVRAVNCGKPVTDTDCPSGLSIYNIYKKVLKLLNIEAVNQ
jgi:MinD superfamily P-loop ATPase containing an inserted ferredoxin domain